MSIFHSENTKKPLKWSMISMLLFGWLLPLLLMILIMIFIVSGRINKQMQHTINTSSDKAVEICTLRIEDCITASKNASYLPTVKESYQEYCKDGNWSTLYYRITLFLKQQYKYNPSFACGIMYFTENPKEIYFTYNTYDSIKAYHTYEERIQEKAETIDTSTVLMNLGGRIYMVRNLVDSSFHPYAVLVLELNRSSVFESLQSIWGYLDGEIYVNGELLMESNPAETEEFSQIRQQVLKEASADSTYYRKGRQSYVSKKVRIDNNRIIYLSRLDSSELFAEMYSVRFIFIILVIFMIPLFLQVLRFFHKRVTRPLQELVMASQQIEDGNYGWEISHMADSMEFFYTDEVFNNMSRQLKNQFEKIYLEEIALRDAKIMALQSQINPHFLNNTLEIINWEARLNENYKVSSMIEALSTMLEATMNRKELSSVTLNEELSYVDAYLYIISQRFGEKFRSTKEIDETLLEIRLPRLIIQPIVENAVEHGMDITRCGHIHIHIYSESRPQQKPSAGKAGSDHGSEHLLIIEVEDNGVLTEQEKEKIDHLLHGEPDTQNEKRVSLGIRNVDQRLKIIYGQDCGLEIFSNRENHTISRMTCRILSDFYAE